MDLSELRVAIATDPGLKRLIIRMVREELFEEPVILCPNSHMLRKAVAPPGMITYAEAARMLQCSTSNIRLIISRGHVDGGNGYIMQDELVRYALTNCSEKTRSAVVQWMDEQEQEHNNAPQHSITAAS